MIYVTFVTKRKKYLKRNKNENVIVKTTFLVRRVKKYECNICYKSPMVGSQKWFSKSII